MLETRSKPSDISIQVYNMGRAGHKLLIADVDDHWRVRYSEALIHSGILVTGDVAAESAHLAEHLSNAAE